MEEENTTESVPTRVWNHLRRNKVAYALGAITISVVALQRSNNKAWEEFLVSREIDPNEFFNPELPTDTL